MVTTLPLEYCGAAFGDLRDKVSYDTRQIRSKEKVLLHTVTCLVTSTDNHRVESVYLNLV